jgi:glycosyltransferase involved in cell wall biosynthesis
MSEKNSSPTQPEAPRVCMCVFSHYPADPRVRREAEALIEVGVEVDVVCLRAKGQSQTETVRGVDVYRLPVERRRGGKVRYLFEYALFILYSFFMIASLHLKRKYRIVHVHNMPDVLVFSGLVPRVMGAKAILDLHDPMPEVFITKYDLAPDHWMIRTLRFLEKASIGFANQVLTPNEAFARLFAQRSCKREKIEIVMNAPQEEVFLKARNEAKPDPNRKGFVVMFHGTVVERHGLAAALEAQDILREEIPGLRFEVYGEGDYVDRFLEIVRERKLEGLVNYHGFVTIETIAAAIPHVDLGLIPNLRSVFTEINLPTRIFEYLGMDKPVIAPNTAGVRDYFDADSLFFFEPGDAQSLCAAIRSAHGDPERRARVLAKGVEVFRRHQWALEKRKLWRTVGGLLGMELGTTAREGA